MRAYVLCGPTLLLLTGLFVIPLLGVFAIALTDWQLGSNSLSFVGLRNFAALWADRSFLAAALNTALYCLMVVPTTLVLALGVALLIHATGTGQALYRSIYFLPVMATMAAMSLAWETLLHPTVGVLNSLLGFIGLHGENWLRDPHTVLPTLAVIGVWQHLGYAMILFLAGLKSIPPDLYEAAEIDGARRAVDRFMTVTLPSLGPVALFTATVVAVKSIQVFDTVRMLTGGGPGDASNVLLHLIYVESFEYLRTGYGAAIAVVFLAATVLLTLLQKAALGKRVHYT